MTDSELITILEAQRAHNQEVNRIQDAGVSLNLFLDFDELILDALGFPKQSSRFRRDWWEEKIYDFETSNTPPKTFLKWLKKEAKALNSEVSK